MIKKPFLILFLLGIMSINSHAQDPYVDAGQLPTTSMQGDFDGTSSNIVNVDLFTGIASVSIPIYNYSIDGLDLGISLSYDAKGIPVDQIASTVGLGWNLNAGGYIQRQVNGMEDEVSIPISEDQYVTLSGENPSFPIVPNNPFYSGILVAGDGANEGESDDFTAVFGGREVEFAIDASGNISTKAHVNIKIQMIVDGTTYTNHLPSNIGMDSVNHLLSFKIIDENGNQFFFSRGDYQDEVNSINNTLYYPTTRWVLTSIITSTGKTVSYTYNSFYLSYKQYNNDQVDESSDINATTFAISNINSQPIYWSGHVSHVASIQYPDGTNVAFQMNNTASRCDVSNIGSLQAIKISKGYDNNTTNSFSYVLNQSYFNSIHNFPDLTFINAEIPLVDGTTCPYIAHLEAEPATYHPPTTSDQAQDLLNLGLRLKLNGITKVGRDGVTAQTYYTFNYSISQLPSRLSPSQDWFGYYNHKLSQAPSDYPGVLLSVPLHSVTDATNPYGVDKTPDVSFLQSDILTGIKNALGGTINISYQAPPNLSDPTPVPTGMDEATETYDGLCVNQISYTDGFSSDNNSVTNYSFANGYRFFPGAYYWYPSSMTNSQITQRTITNHMISPIDFYNGSNHGYSNVSVVKNGYNSELLSRTDYVFTNILDGSGNSYLDNTQTLPLVHTFPRASMDQSQMGLVKEIDEYSNATSPVKKTLNTYTTHAFTPIVNPSTWSCPNLLQVDEDGQWTVTGGTQLYNVFNSAAVNVAQTQTISIINGQSMESDMSYQYNGRDQVTQQSWTDTKGAAYTKTNYYNYDYNVYNYTTSNTNQQNAVTAIQNMDDDDLHVLLATDTKKINPWSSTPMVVSFSQWQPNYNNGVMTVNGSVSATLSQAIPATQFYSSNSTTYATNSFYNYDANVNNQSQATLFDDHNNVLETWVNNHQNASSTMWDTRIGQPVAKASNSAFANIAYTSFEGVFTSPLIQDYNKGNWTFDPDFVVLGSGTDKAMTGQYYYALQPSIAISSNILQGGETYVLSFWSTQKPEVILNDDPSQAVTMNLQLQVGNWKLYTGYVPGSSNGYGNQIFINASGAVIKIDDLRLYPQEAVMDTYTYLPLLGVSSHTDTRNNIIYYNYDALGNLKTTTDINGNILSLTNTVIQGSDN